MKKTICPKCNKKMTLKSCGNQDGAIHKVVKSKRTTTSIHRAPVRYKKIAKGLKYQMTLSCGCKSEKGFGLLTNVIGDSLADCRFKLGKHASKKA